MERRWLVEWSALAVDGSGERLQTSPKEALQPGLGGGGGDGLLGAPGRLGRAGSGFAVAACHPRGQAVAPAGEIAQGIRHQLDPRAWGRSQG